MAKNTFQENILRVVAVIGLIAVLLLGAWGIIQLAFFIPSFLGNIGGSLAPKTATTATTVKTAVVTETPKPIATPAKSAASTKYVASGRTTNLYGYPDLAVRIISAPTAVRAGAQVSLQFVIENVGTNVVPANWIFTAALPYNPVYTYQSPVQQALYPGDKIIYTLGYTAQYGGTNQTGYGNCDGWTYPCNPAQPIYGGPGTCNAYGPCNIPGYAPNVYGYAYPQTYGGTQSVSITADPYNPVWESNESNNTAGISYQVY